MQHRCPLCKGFYLLDLKDIDLPEASRTQANLWKSKFFEMRIEVVRANKGIKRLRKKLDRLEKPLPPSTKNAENALRAECGK